MEDVIVKKNIKNKTNIIIKIILYVVLVFLIILYLSHVFLPNGTLKYNNQRNTDVYVVGASGVQTGIIPMEIYDQIGVTVENISSGEVQLPMDYYLIKQNISKNKPKIIFLDGETFYATEMQSRELMHNTIDKYPLNFNKLEFVNEKAYKMNFNEKITYLFPFFRFHDRWKDIKLNNFKYQIYGYSNYNHGFVLQTNIIDSKYLNKDYMSKADNENEMKDLYTANYSEIYLKKIKELCEKEDIDLVLLVLPRQNWSMVKHNILQKIADENNLRLIDMNLLFNELNFNQENDLMNDNHVNLNGAIKASNYLASFIAENYEMKNHKNDLKYDNWNKDLEKYNKEKIQWLNEYNKKLLENSKEV